MPPDCTNSEFELFKSLSNPRKTNFAKTSVVSRAIEKELSNSPPPPPSPSPSLTRPPSLPPIKSPQLFPLSPPRSESLRSVRSYRDEEPRMEEEDPEDVTEKQALLVELNQLKMEGVILSRDFSMADSVGDMRFEVNRIRTNGAASDAANLATSCLQMAVMGAETANNKWGPILHLNGWSQTVSGQQEAYRSVFTQLYKKHFKKGTSVSPEVQLALLVGGSAFMTHLGQSVDGDMKDFFMNNIPNLVPGVAKSKPSPPPPPSYSPPPPPPSQPSPPGAFTQRPSMKRPSPIPKPTPIPPTPSPQPQQTSSMREAEIDQFRAKIQDMENERAALRAQLHQQVNTMPPPIFMAHVKTSSHMHSSPASPPNLPDIEILN